MLARTETDMTAFTDEHHAITQTTTDSFESRFPSQTEVDFVESPLKQPPSPDSPISPDDDQSPFIVETDYLCWPDDLPYPYPIDPSSAVSSTPLQPSTLISSALAFESKASALNASAIILLLKPLLPDDVIDHHQAAAILRQHHARLMSMKLFAEAALLRKLCMKGWPGGALLAWGENYPAIFSAAQQGVQVSFVCTSCHKPRDVDRSAGSTDSVWQCERCKAVMAPCAVCGERDTAPTLSSPSSSASSNSTDGQTGEAGDEPILTTWWYCPGCGHGGHSSCLQAWHATLESGDFPALEDAPGAEPSDGCCPLDGCGHACLPSRDNVMMTRTEEVSRVVREATRAVAKATVAAAAAAAADAAAAKGMGGEDVIEGGAGAGGHAVLVGGENSHHHGEFGVGGGVHTGKYGGGGASAVRSDGNDIPQSRAVETVREALSGSGASGRTGTGILSSSPGRGGIGVERERRKSVKFVATDERR
jgi:ribosomal protein L37AE/L43A